MDTLTTLLIGSCQDDHASKCGVGMTSVIGGSSEFFAFDRLLIWAHPTTLALAFSEPCQPKFASFVSARWPITSGQ